MSIVPAPPVIGEAEFARRIGLTIAAIVVYRIGAHIPLAGLAPDALTTQTANAEGDIERLSVMALGIIPWFSALVIVQMALVCLPPLRRWRDREPANARRIELTTLALGLVLCVVQAWGVAVAIEEVPGLVATPQSGFGATTIATLAGGAILAMLLAQFITREGIGGGIWILMLLPVVMALPTVVAGALAGMTAGIISPPAIVIALAIPALSAAAVVALLMWRHNRGAAQMDEVIWPALLAGTAMALATGLALVSSPGATDLIDHAMLPGSPLWFLSTAVAIIVLTHLMDRAAGTPHLAPLTATVLVAVALVPELARTYVAIPMIIEGRLLIVLAAVLFMTVQMWQRARTQDPAASAGR